ncbi:TPA: NAD(P)H-binding protein [Streptococcus suis]|nr:NAD(P)H-binding protein [Streptococcus suis]
MQNVLLFGASGFLGQAVMEELIANGYKLTAITRSFDPINTKKFRPDVNWVTADVYQVDEWKDLLEEHSIVINLIGMVQENPEKGLTFETVITDAAKAIASPMVGKPDYHYIFISTNLQNKSTPEHYRRAKRKAEDYLQRQVFKTSIVRPSMMYGKGKDGTIEKAQAILSKISPNSPSWFNQPIAVENVARTIATIVAGKTKQMIFENGDML